MMCKTNVYGQSKSLFSLLWFAQLSLDFKTSTGIVLRVTVTQKPLQYVKVKAWYESHRDDVLSSVGNLSHCVK